MPPRAEAPPQPRCHRSIARYIALAAPLALGACALPPAVHVATLIANGFSYIASEKSISDHGLSMIAGEDCALHRGLTGGAVCDDWPADDDILVAGLDGAAASTPAETVGTPAPAATATRPAETAETLAALDLAAGPVLPLGETVAAEGEAADAGPARAAPAGGLYYALGSFIVRANAERLLRANALLAPTLTTARVGGRAVFRVVVGPVAAAERASVKRALAAAGFRNAWALRDAGEEI